MSYLQKRRPLGGLTSSRRGPRIARSSLGILGDDTLSADWQAQMLSTAKEALAFDQARDQRDRNQKWIQIGVTAAIPLFAALYRGIGLLRRRTST